MSGSVLTGLINTVGFALRLLTIGDQAVKVSEKVSKYDAETWRARDYVEVGARVTCIAADGLSVSSDAISRQCESEIVGLIDKIQGGSPEAETAIKALGVAAETLQDAKLARAISAGVGLGSYAVGEVASGRPIEDVVSSPSVLGRILDATTSSAALNSHSGNLAAQLIGVTGFTLAAGPIAIERFNIIANNFYNRYTLDIRNYNDESKPGEIPLTIPPDDYRYDSILDRYDNDPVFSNYRCLITNSPIRYPVRFEDNGVEHFYELSAIHEWIRRAGTNPLTRLPVRLEEVYVDFNAQRLIENRMRELSIPLE